MFQNILMIILLILMVTNLIFLFVFGAFLVRTRDRINSIFSDLIEAMETMWGAIPVESKENEIKTWDQKYEEEMENIQKRLRGDSGLKDLAEPGLSWGEPPSLNQKNTEGLIIKDR